MYSHKKIRVVFHRTLQKIKLPLCYTLRDTHVEKSTTVFLTVRNVKVLHLAAHPDWACIPLLASCKLILFGWMCLTESLDIYFFVCSGLDVSYWVAYRGLRELHISFFFCVLLLVFPCSCTECGVCPILQLSAGQDTSLVQCVTQSGLLHSARTRGYLVFTKGAWNGSFICSLIQYTSALHDLKCLNA